MPTQSVMLLDDDPFMLSLLEDMFVTLGGFAISCESDARRALQRLQQQAPDVLVMDLGLPDMDGIEFLQAAGQSGYRGKIVLLTGMDVAVRRAAERLAVAHGLQLAGAFSKPLRLQELEAALA